MHTGSIWRRTVLLAAVGGGVFWLANFAISLTPIAADYRAVLSISYVPMLVEALLGGLLVGLAVSYFLVRFYGRIPANDSIGKALLLSFLALILATLLLEVPAKLLSSSNDGTRLFLIALAFNVVRFLALGLAIGYLNDRLYGPMRKWRPMQ